MGITSLPRKDKLRSFTHHKGQKTGQKAAMSKAVFQKMAGIMSCSTLSQAQKAEPMIYSHWGLMAKKAAKDKMQTFLLSYKFGVFTGLTKSESRTLIFFARFLDRDWLKLAVRI